MKKKTLSDLLQKLEEARNESTENISDLNEMLSKKMLKGGYDTTNLSCSGSNSSCGNGNCRGTSNGDCYNANCIV